MDTEEQSMAKRFHAELTLVNFGSTFCASIYVQCILTCFTLWPHNMTVWHKLSQPWYTVSFSEWPSSHCQDPNSGVVWIHSACLNWPYRIHKSTPPWWTWLWGYAELQIRDLLWCDLTPHTPAAVFCVSSLSLSLSPPTLRICFTH